MKVLELHQYLFSKLFIFPLADNSSRKKKCFTYLFGAAVLLFDVLSFIASVLYFFENTSSNFGVSLHGIVEACDYGCTLYTLLLSIIVRNKFMAIFKKMQANYDSASQEMKGFLEMVNNKNIVIISYRLKYYVVGFPMCVAIIAITNIIYCLIKYGYVDTVHLYYPAKYVLPWDQTTIPGWIGMVIFTMFGGFSYFFLNNLFLSLFTSICELHNAFHQNFKYLLGELDVEINFESASIRNIQTLFTRIVENNNKGKEFFKQTANIYSAFLVTQVAFDAISLIGAILQLHSASFMFQYSIFAIEDTNISFGTPIIRLIGGLLNVFIYCYIGYKPTENYIRVGNYLYGLNWQKLPRKYQMYLALMIQDSQKPSYYHGFNTIYLHLGTFMKVLNSVYSYYMIMKTLSGK